MLKNAKPTYYTKEELQAMLPKVGDRLVKPMTRAATFATEIATPKPCTVVEVNEEYFWYRVRFDCTGTHQCFKLPEI